MSDVNLNMIFSQSPLAISGLEEAQNMTDDIDVGEQEAEELSSLVGVLSHKFYIPNPQIAQRSNDHTCKPSSRRRGTRGLVQESRCGR